MEARILWINTTVETQKQLKNGLEFFQIEKKVHTFLSQFPHDWIATTTNKRRCGAKPTDYMYFKIVGLEEPSTDEDGISYYMKIQKGVCGECRNYIKEKLDCNHPGKTVCGCTLFFIPETIKE
jgi:hypothetical protein